MYNTSIFLTDSKLDVSRIIYKPTGDMESDFLTKALQGKAFHAHCKTLMGLDGVNEFMFYKKYKNQNG